MKNEYLTHEDQQILEYATTFEELRDVAFQVLYRMPRPIGQVCGPIRSGGLSSIEKNVEELARAIARLRDSGVNIFDQTPFEKPMWRIIDTPHFRGGNHLLETFYLPLFESGLVETLYFIPGWESSHGARWEHAQAERLWLDIVYLE